MLVRGVILYRLGAVVAALALLPPLTRGAVPGAAAVMVAVLVLAAGLAARGRWWILRTVRGDLEATLTAACRRVLAPFSAEGGDIAVRLGAAPLAIIIRPFASRSFTLRFSGPWRSERKAMLLQRLVAKQYEPAIPRVKIRLGRAR